MHHIQNLYTRFGTLTQLQWTLCILFLFAAQSFFIPCYRFAEDFTSCLDNKVLQFIEVTLTFIALWIALSEWKAKLVREVRSEVADILDANETRKTQAIRKLESLVDRVGWNMLEFEDILTIQEVYITLENFKDAGAWFNVLNKKTRDWADILLKFYILILQHTYENDFSRLKKDYEDYLTFRNKHKSVYISQTDWSFALARKSITSLNLNENIRTPLEFLIGTTHIQGNLSKELTQDDTDALRAMIQRL